MVLVCTCGAYHEPRLNQQPTKGLTNRQSVFNFSQHSPSLLSNLAYVFSIYQKRAGSTCAPQYLPLHWQSLEEVEPFHESFVTELARGSPLGRNSAELYLDRRNWWKKSRAIRAIILDTLFCSSWRTLAYECKVFYDSPLESMFCVLRTKRVH